MYVRYKLILHMMGSIEMLFHCMYLCLLSVTLQDSFLALAETFDMVHRMCPTAYMVVIGTKADLRASNSVTPEDAEVSDMQCTC